MSHVCQATWLLRVPELSITSAHADCFHPSDSISAIRSRTFTVESYQAGCEPPNDQAHPPPETGARNERRL